MKAAAILLTRTAEGEYFAYNVEPAGTMEGDAVYKVTSPPQAPVFDTTIAYCTEVLRWQENWGINMQGRKAPR